MPNLPRPRLRRDGRARGGVVPPPEPDRPNVEIVETPGLRWINIERPRAVDRAWLEEHFDFHPLDYEDVLSRNQRPKVDEYEGFLLIIFYAMNHVDEPLGIDLQQVSLFAGSNYVLTLHNGELPTLDQTSDRWCANHARINMRAAGLLVGLGVSLFVVSDTVLALGRFVAPRPWTRPVTMLTYHGAQALIVAGLLL